MRPARAADSVAEEARLPRRCRIPVQPRPHIGATQEGRAQSLTALNQRHGACTLTRSQEPARMPVREQLEQG
jgi:hypothetical protein